MERGRFLTDASQHVFNYTNPPAMKDDKSISRRSFIQRISVVGAMSLGAGSLLTACGGGEEAETETATQAEPQGGAAETSGQTAEASFSCNDDLSGLTEQEIQMRQTLEYTDNSPFEDKVCNNCALWVPPEGGAQCGGCNLLKGPIHPQGHCTSWAPQQT